MPRFSGKKADAGVPVTIDRDRYTEGDSSATLEGNVTFGEKPGNVTFPIQLDASGYLKVNVVTGGSAGHEYQDGDVNTNAYGHLCLGDDGANLQTISVGANGRLQVEVVAGDYDAVQYQDGAAVASPFGYVALGHDGSNVFPVVVDASGYLQVDIRNLPADTFVVEGGALGKGVLIQGDDGVDRHNVAVDASGNVQVDIIAALPAGNAAIGKLAANSGVDIGDVDVKSQPADTFAAEGAALGKGVLIQGDDGVDRHNVAVDVDGNVQVDIVASLPAGNAAIGKLAANDGVDIGDVDVASQPADIFVAENGALGKGVLLQGDDGTDRHNVAVDVDGHLQVDILSGGGSNDSVATEGVAATKGTQISLDDGTDSHYAQANAAGDLKVTLDTETVDVDVKSQPADTFSAEDSALGKGVLVQGDDGIDRQNLTVVSGRAHVDVLAMPGETFEVEGNALGKGVLIQGDDGTDRHNVAVDVDGNVQVDIIAALPSGTNAIGKLAANDGVDIGDVDVTSLPIDTFAAEGQALGKGVLLQGDDGTDRHNVAVDPSGHLQVDEVKASTLNSVADVTLAATATTQIVGALASRLCVLISNKKTNTQTFRIGDSNAGATRGVELAPGQSISIETTEAVYGYNPGGSGEAVTVIWTED